MKPKMSVSHTAQELTNLRDDLKRKQNGLRECNLLEKLAVQIDKEAKKLENDDAYIQIRLTLTIVSKAISEVLRDHPQNLKTKT